jgi:hypothetical protein
MAILSDYFPYLIIMSAALSVIACVGLLWLTLRLKKLFKGADGRDVHGVIRGIKREIASLTVAKKDFSNYIDSAEVRIKKSVKHVGMVRFNSFQNLGGSQSFSLAMLDENKDGIVLSSLYGREGNRVYAKTIVKGAPQYKLLQEEEEAIKLAVSRQ